ncbi:hypothetical protein [Streptomyces sp. CoH27]|uniref:hypothetical protein n=1 Tax=Streptomyces sp. CoH27 TaxID=2875763 RepID=UPI0035A9949D
MGLDLGARTPEKTAVAITAEIVAAGNRRTGLPLSGLAARSTGTESSCGARLTESPPNGHPADEFLPGLPRSRI